MTVIKMKRGQAADWTGTNPLLQDGEIGFETDTLMFKFGNGLDHWTDLDYASAGGGGGGGGGDGTDPDALHLQSDIVLQAVDEFITHVVIEDDGTLSSGWPNRMSFEFKPDADTTIGQHLTAWFNEYGEFRVTPAKINTVPFRAFTKELNTDDEHDSATPVMEMVWARNQRDEIWGVMADGTMYTAGPIERRVPDGPTLQVGHIFLEEADSVPINTPSGTLIVRYDA